MHTDTNHCIFLSHSLGALATPPAHYGNGAGKVLCTCVYVLPGTSVGAG